MEPLFSIVIVNFNCGIYLEKAIKSVISQSFKDYEIILVDGGSNDNSLDIIYRYKNYFSWWVSEPDKGQSDAFNKGFSHAKGKFFVWLNSDDIMLPDTLLSVSRCIAKNPTREWFAVNTVYINAEDFIQRCFVESEFCNKILLHGTLSDIGPSSFFSRELFAQYGPFDVDNHYTMDLDLWMKLVKAGYKYKRVNHFGWAFRVHELSKTSAGITGEASPKHKVSREKVYKNNEFHEKWSCLMYQKIKKAVTCYMASLYYTSKYKNKNAIKLD